MHIKYKDPSVVLINSYDEKKKAWLISRPHLDHADLDKDIGMIESMDLPINGFASYVLHFNSSLLFRDLIFSIRPVVIWAKSNRTTPINENNMFLSGEYNINKRHESNRDIDSLNFAFNLIKQGNPQDFAKKKLPMSCNTEFTISIDDRTLVAFIKLLKYHNKELYEIYGKRILNVIGKEYDYIDNRHSVDIYEKLAISQEEYENIDSSFNVLDSIISVHKVSGNLMSQFIRQHYSVIKNELFNIVNSKSLFDIYLNCDDDIVVAAYSNKHSIKKLISTRTCWFAQFDQSDNSSWSYILKPFIEKMSSKDFLDQLPCNGLPNNCKIKADMIPRIDLKEVNLPCPILIENPILIKRRGVKYSSESEVFKKWTNLLNKHSIKDNKFNELRIEYENNIKKYGEPE